MFPWEHPLLEPAGSTGWAFDPRHRKVRFRRMEIFPRYKDWSLGAADRQREECNVLSVIDIGSERHGELFG